MLYGLYLLLVVFWMRLYLEFNFLLIVLVILENVVFIFLLYREILLSLEIC